jgi:DNA-binding response OmpR family regulator
MNFRSYLSSPVDVRVRLPSLTEQLRDVMIENDQRTVLFADDDPSIQNVVWALTTVFAMELTVVGTCAELKTILEKRSFDIVILDFMLSNGDSANIYREQLSKCPGTQVVFITGRSLDEVSTKVHEAGPAMVFPKPAAFSLPFMVHLLAQMGVRVRRPIKREVPPHQPHLAGAF